MRFYYTAFNGSGKELRGTLTANDQPEAASKIKDLGLFPINIKTDEQIRKEEKFEQNPRGKMKRMSQADLCNLVSEIYDH